MYEEWFEKLANRLEIKTVKQTKTMIDLELSERVSKCINGEDLFMMSYEISRNFKLNYHENKIHIVLELVNLEKHFLVYIIDLLNIIYNKYGVS